MELSKLPKDILIEILLKVNKWEYYKISILNREDFYLKCQSKGDVMKFIAKSTNIKSMIMDIWKNHNDIDLYINTEGMEIFFHYYHCGSIPDEKWEQNLHRNLESIVSPLFPKVLEQWMETGLSGISIDKIDMIY
jgi:hypothetical protein